MRRRQRSGDMPEHLVIFSTGDWPGGDVREQHAAFLAAREAWKAEHGIVGWIEGDPVPDEPWDPSKI